jgi:hypothetical protein
VPRLIIGLVVVVVVVTVYTVIDCAMSAGSRVRGIPKWAWLLVTLLLPVIGAILWYAVGRPRRGAPPARRVTAPDDDPDFLGGIRLDRDEQETIARLERDFAEHDEPGDAEGTGRRDA